MACYFVHGFLSGRGPVPDELKQTYLRHIGATYPGGPVYFVSPTDVETCDKNFHTNRIEAIDPKVLQAEFEKVGVKLCESNFQPRWCGVWKLTEITNPRDAYYPELINLGDLVYQTQSSLDHKHRGEVYHSLG